MDIPLIREIGTLIVLINGTFVGIGTLLIFIFRDKLVNFIFLTLKKHEAQFDELTQASLKRQKDATKALIDSMYANDWSRSSDQLRDLSKEIGNLTRLISPVVTALPKIEKELHDQGQFRENIMRVIGQLEGKTDK